MASTNATSSYIAIAGKRVVITDATAARLLDAKEHPADDPWAAGVYSALTAAAHRDDRRRARGRRVI